LVQVSVERVTSTEDDDVEGPYHLCQGLWGSR
jgi:hypothetical protein